MFSTMSTSCAPSFSTRLVSSHLLAGSVAPSGNPITTPTGTPVPASVSDATLTHVGFTIAQYEAMLRGLMAQANHLRPRGLRLQQRVVQHRGQRGLRGERLGGKRRRVERIRFCN